MTEHVGRRSDVDESAYARIDGVVAAMIRQSDEEEARLHGQGAALRNFRASLQLMREAGLPVPPLHGPPLVAPGNPPSSGGDAMQAGEAKVTALLDEIGHWPATDLEGAAREVKSRTRTANVVADVVNKVGKPLSSRDIVREVKDRGFLDPDWKTPAATVAQAARRAVKQGLIKRLGDGRFAPLAYSDSVSSPEERGSNDLIEGDAS